MPSHSIAAAPQEERPRWEFEDGELFAFALLILLARALLAALLLARLLATLLLLIGTLPAALLLVGTLLSAALLLLLIGTLPALLLLLIGALPAALLLVAALALVLVRHKISPLLHSWCCLPKQWEIASFRPQRPTELFGRRVTGTYYRSKT